MNKIDFISRLFGMDLEQLFHDLDKLKTPKEIDKYFHDIKSITNRSDELTKLARLKIGGYKEFLEEFYPLYCFSKSKYCREASKMRIVIGNQGYDAVIIFNDGSEERYEITGYQDGEWDKINAKQLNETGAGIVNVEWVESIAEKQKKYLRKVMENVNNKAQKDYTGVNIIFVVNTFDHFEIFDQDSNNFINELIKAISDINLRAKNIYLLRLRNCGIEEIDTNLFVVS